MCRKKKSTTNLQNKEISHKSPAHGQPRYTTRNMDSISTAADRFRDPKQDYENVIVGQLQPTKIKPYDHLKEEGSHHGKSNAIIEDDNIYLESDVNDQPIYSNTQALYYDYTDPTSNLNKEQDDVYILPDQ
ncbi:uncharacterized protein WCC33_001119 [Rhinophrynus dorsalis]